MRLSYDSVEKSQVATIWPYGQRRLRTDPLLLPAAIGRPPASLSSQQRIFANIAAERSGDPTSARLCQAPIVVIAASAPAIGAQLFQKKK
jgi:hypothetical protein